MNTESIEFVLMATSCGDVYTASFAGCDIELSCDLQTLQVVGPCGNHETWIRDNAREWAFEEGSNGQAPTLGWPIDYYNKLETAINLLEEKGLQ
jgi:hypothetical protein